MSPEAAALFAKAKLTVEEMTRLIADRMAELPTVRAVSIEEAGEIAIALVGGKHIELQAVPVAHAFNASLDARRRTLDALVERCA